MIDKLIITLVESTLLGGVTVFTVVGAFVTRETPLRIVSGVFSVIAVLLWGLMLISIWGNN